MADAIAKVTLNYRGESHDSKLYNVRSRPAFCSIIAHLDPKFSLEEMIDVVIEYCQTRVLLSELLSEVQKANPSQYERYRTKLQQT